MVNISQFEQYFPDALNWIKEGAYKFKINLHESNGFFSINLKIKQEDAKEENLIKIRMGMGKHDISDSIIHDASIPHFELECYERKKDSFAISLYFEFQDLTDDDLIKNIKGTIALINDFIKNFLHKKCLNPCIIGKIICNELVESELTPFKEDLMKGFYSCFKNKKLTARTKKGLEIISTSRKLEKFMDNELFKPIYMPFKSKIN